jgi:hypothetical protein
MFIKQLGNVSRGPFSPEDKADTLSAEVLSFLRSTLDNDRSSYEYRTGRATIRRQRFTPKQESAGQRYQS